MCTWCLFVHGNALRSPPLGRATPSAPPPPRSWFIIRKHTHAHTATEQRYYNTRAQMWARRAFVTPCCGCWMCAGGKNVTYAFMDGCVCVWMYRWQFGVPTKPGRRQGREITFNTSELVRSFGGSPLSVRICTMMMIRLIVMLKPTTPQPRHRQHFHPTRSSYLLKAYTGSTNFVSLMLGWLYSCWLFVRLLLLVNMYGIQ